jgi:hypothetical protein
MGDFIVTITIERPTDTVFAFIAEPFPRSEGDFDALNGDAHVSILGALALAPRRTESVRAGGRCTATALSS